MKKLLAVLMVVALLIGCASVLSACSKEKTHVGKWYYAENNLGAAILDVRENGTYIYHEELSKFAPDEYEKSEYDGDTFEYELVYAPEYILEEWYHIYYDEEKDQLHWMSDGHVFIFNRKK